MIMDYVMTRGVLLLEFGVGDYKSIDVVTRATIKVDAIEDKGTTEVAACKGERGLPRI